MKFNTFKRVKKLTNQEILTEIELLEKVDYTALFNKEIPYHIFGYVHTFRVISDGLHLSLLKQFVGGLLAGIWISFAYTAISFSTYSIDNSSVAKILTGFIFIGSMVLILFLGGGFLTAYLWYSRAMFKGVEKWSVFLKACWWVYLGNITGIGFFVAIFYLSDGYASDDNLLLTKIYENYGLNKMGIIGNRLKTSSAISGTDVFKTIGTVFGSAVLCGLLICVAIQGSKSTKGDIVASIMVLACIVVFFGIGGYQHCVANWYAAWVIIFMTLDNQQELLTLTFNNNTFWWYILINIFPSIIGNFVGSLIIGLFMSWFNADYDHLLIKNARLNFLKETLKMRDNRDK
ncbi:formate/nitrite transporter family protein [Mesoplasma syrphidae]|nr:formate/nitrite transporter family protein [Mesoplasma syrphidae]